MRSSKLVSIRLNAVVCELAMLPEMFSSAKDCARNPVTAVVRAPKIPMTDLQLRSGRPSGAVATRLWPHDRNGRRNARASNGREPDFHIPPACDILHDHAAGTMTGDRLKNDTAYQCGPGVSFVGLDLVHALERQRKV